MIKYDENDQANITVTTRQASVAMALGIMLGFFIFIAHGEI